MYQPATFSAYQSSVLKQEFWLEAKVPRVQQLWQEKDGIGCNISSPEIQKSGQKLSTAPQAGYPSTAVHSSAQQVSASISPPTNLFPPKLASWDSAQQKPISPFFFFKI